MLTLHSLPRFSSLAPIRRLVAGALHPGAALLLALGVAACSIAAAQTPPPTVHVSGIHVESTIGSNFGEPDQIAIDSSGNLYIADDANNQVLKLVPTGGGAYTQTSIGSGLSSPYGVAVDSKGNVYIADTDNGRVVKETLQTGGLYTQTTVALTGLGAFVYQLALDSLGNLYVTDIFNNRVVVAKFNGTSVTQTYITGTVASPLAGPQGVAVDSSGNVYIADTGNNRVVKETPSGGSYTQSVVADSFATDPTNGMNDPTAVALAGTTVYIADSFNARIVSETYNSSTKTYTQNTIPTSTLMVPMGVAADSQGDIFIADSQHKRVIEEQAITGNLNFGTVEMGLANPPQATVTFTFDKGGAIGAPSVVTQGAPGLDFTNTSASTCKATTFATGKTCSLVVAFSPKFAGIRYGAAILSDDTGNPVATAYAVGSGSGPEINFPPGTHTSIGGPFGKPFGVAVDGAGNFYVADYTAFRVFKETLEKGVYVKSTVGSGFSNPSAVAVDGAGNVYVSDIEGMAGAVYKETRTSTGYTQSVVVNSGLSEPVGVAVDGEGNVYIADSLNDRILKETPGTSGYTQSVVDANIGNVWGVAVDSAGNVYGAAHSDDLVYKDTPSGSTYTQTQVQTSQLNLPAGLDVDGSGNLFIADDGNNRVIEETFSSAGATEIEITSGLAAPYGVAVDGGGDVFIAESGNATVLEQILFSPPSLNFQKVNTGTVSASQSVTVQNVGTAPLTFPVPATGSNPSIASNFLLDSSASTACPLVAAGASTPGALAPGESCDLVVTAAPHNAGSISGSLILTDNNLNAAGPGYANQTISLAVDGLRGRAPLVWITPAPITYGRRLSATQLNAVAKFEGVTIPGKFVYSPALGTVLAAGHYLLTVTFTPTDTTDWSSNTSGVTLNVEPAELTIIADSAERTYGAANPAFLYTLDGLVNGDTPSAIQGAPALSTTADAFYPWGNYEISIGLGTLKAANYSFFLVPGTLFIQKATLTVTATNASVTQGQPIPAFTYSVSGFVNSESATVLSGKAAEATTATSSSPAGTYPIAITQGSLWAENYDFNFVNGTLTITSPAAKNPSFTHATGRYAPGLSVTLSDATPGATIYYTTNGAAPTAESAKYTGPIKVDATESVKAIAIAGGLKPSAVVTETYTIARSPAD